MERQSYSYILSLAISTTVAVKPEKGVQFKIPARPGGADSIEGETCININCRRLELPWMVIVWCHLDTGRTACACGVCQWGHRTAHYDSRAGCNHDSTSAMLLHTFITDSC